MASCGLCTRKPLPPRFALSACGSLNKGIWVAWEAGGCREILEFRRPEAGKKGDRAGRGKKVRDSARKMEGSVTPFKNPSPAYLT